MTHTIVKSETSSQLVKFYEYLSNQDIDKLNGYYKCSDVIKAMDIDSSNTSKYVTSHIGKENTRELGGTSGRPSYYCNDIGIFNLCLKLTRNNEPIRKLKRWLAENVLPSIMKNGYYLDNNMSNEQITQAIKELTMRQIKN